MTLKTEPQTLSRFPLIAEAIRGMREPSRFAVGEQVLIIVGYTDCRRPILLPGRVERVVGRTFYLVETQYRGAGWHVYGVPVLDVMKLDAIRTSEEI